MEDGVIIVWLITPFQVEINHVFKSHYFGLL